MKIRQKNKIKNNSALLFSLTINFSIFLILIGVYLSFERVFRERLLDNKYFLFILLAIIVILIIWYLIKIISKKSLGFLRIKKIFGNKKQTTTPKKSVGRDWWWNTLFSIAGLVLIIFLTLFISNIFRGWNWEWRGIPEHVYKTTLRQSPDLLDYPGEIISINRVNRFKAHTPYRWKRELGVKYDFIPEKSNVKVLITFTLVQNPHIFLVGYHENVNGYFKYTHISGDPSEWAGIYTITTDQDVDIFVRATKK